MFTKSILYFNIQLPIQIWKIQLHFYGNGAINA